MKKIIIVARVRRLGKRPPSKFQVYMVWGNGQNNELLSFINGKRE
jgi:hypothetical protein